MPIAFNCPSCQKKLTVKDEMAGKVAKCPCGTKLRIPAAAPQGAAPASPQAAQPQVPQAQVPQNPAQQNPAQQPAAGSAFESAFAGVPTGSPTARQPMMGAQPTAGLQPQVAAPQAPMQQMQAPDNLQNINPDFKVQCIQCGQEYPMRPDLFGQTVQCRCGAPVRFEDPLGAGGAMINQDPLGLGAAMETQPNQPVAYQSLSQPDQSKKSAKAREDEVLKMYIKDEEEFEKATKVTKRGGGNNSGTGAVGAVVAGLTGVDVDEDDGDGSGGFWGLFGGFIAFIVLGIIMITSPDAVKEEGLTWSDAEGLKEMALIIIWGFYTGIVLCALGGIGMIMLFVNGAKS